MVRLMDRLSAVEEVRLVTGPGLTAFYERFGFTVDAGPSMRRSSDAA